MPYHEHTIIYVTVTYFIVMRVTCASFLVYVLQCIKQQ